MARSRRQARRSGGNDGLPAWAWLMMGVVVTIAVIMIAPKYFKADHDGFFRPRPNPDAEPAPAPLADEAGVADERPAAKKPRASTDDGDGNAADVRKQDYDFYTLLPGKEVPVSDAEIAATERAEEERRQRREAEAMARSQAAAAAAVEPAEPAAVSTPEPLPEPVVEPARAEPRVATAPVATPVPAASKPAAAVATKPAATNEPADDGTRYLLQAGAFQASGQAEELKARIALLGLGARVESAQIDGKTVYRVRMGPYGTAGDLAEAKRKLGNGGLAAMAIKVK